MWHGAIRGTRRIDLTFSDKALIQMNSTPVPSGRGLLRAANREKIRAQRTQGRYAGKQNYGKENCP